MHVLSNTKVQTEVLYTHLLLTLLCDAQIVKDVKTPPGGVYFDKRRISYVMFFCLVYMLFF